MTSAPNAWIHQLSETLSKSLELSSWGAPPPFPWKQVMHLLQQIFHIEDLEIELGTCEWKLQEQATDGLGEHLLFQGIEISPLEGSLQLAIPKEDADQLSLWFGFEDKNTLPFSDEGLKEGFLRFVSANVLHSLHEAGYFSSLSPKITTPQSLSSQVYSIDIALTHQKTTIWLRLFIHSDFQESYRKYYAHFAKPDLIKNFGHLQTFVSVQLGLSTLSSHEWQQVEEGDFLILDHANFQMEKKQGIAQLLHDTSPLFQVKIKNGQIKILDYALYSEEHEMDREEETKEEELPSSEEKAQEETQEDLEEASHKEEPQDLEEIDEEYSHTEETGHKHLVAATDIPLDIRVEVGRLSMSIEKLMQLRPGSVLELPFRLEDGVSLIANGKLIGKGELVQIGDLIGVKILQTAHDTTK